MPEKNDFLDAEKRIQEEGSVRIDDDHENEQNEDSLYKLYTPTNLGYKVDFKNAKKERDIVIKKENASFVMLVKEANTISNETAKVKKLSEIEKKHESTLKKIESTFKKTDEALQAKYAEEIKYHISPRIKRKAELIDSDVLLSVRHLKQFFFFGNKIHNQKLKAVSNVSFDVMKGECFGIVGESGCGKTTTGRSIIKLYKPTSGAIYYRGYRVGAGYRWNQKEIKWTKKRKPLHIAEFIKQKDEAIAALDQSDPAYTTKVSKLEIECQSKIAAEKQKVKEIVSIQRKKIRQIKFEQRHYPKKLMNEIQMIFQDPVDSLDPRMTVEDIIQEGLRIQGFRNKKENHKKVAAMLEKVGLVEEHASRYPHEFSGGQRQRIGIARALIMNPKLLICDEPISALDVSIRAQVINLLNDLKDEMGLTLIFIAHDLSVVKYFCDRIAVMYFGKLVELAASEELFKHPLHPYTKALLSAIPKPNPLTEKDRVRVVYKPQEAHDYSVDKPELREVCPGHTVYCNKKEFEEYQKIVKEK